MINVLYSFERGSELEYDFGCTIIQYNLLIYIQTITVQYLLPIVNIGIRGG